MVLDEYTTKIVLNLKPEKIKGETPEKPVWTGGSFIAVA